MNCEEMFVNNIFIEENGTYCIDCRNAVWATDKMHASLMQGVPKHFAQWKIRKYRL